MRNYKEIQTDLHTTYRI